MRADARGPSAVGRRGEVSLIDDAVAHECGHAAPRDILVRELGGPDGATAYGGLHCDPDDARTLAALDGLADRSARLDTLRAAWAASPNAHGPCGSSCPGEWFAEGFRLAVLGDAAWWSWTPDPAIRGTLGG